MKKIVRTLWLLFPWLAVACSPAAPTFSPVPFPEVLVNKTYFQEKNSLYRSLKLTDRDIVMVGDDLMDRGLWDVFFEEKGYGGAAPHIRNRGIATETAEGTLYRIDSIAASHPQKLFLSTGWQDVRRFERPAVSIFACCKEITDRIHALSPATAVYWLCPPPDTLILHSSRKKEITDSLHLLMQTYAAESRKCDYIDLRPSLTDHTGAVKEAYTFDGGITFNGAGYACIVERMRPYMGSQFRPVIQADTLRYPHKHPYYQTRVSLINSACVPKNQVIILGNSLTNNGEWQEMLPGVPVYNFGVSGDVAEGVLERLDRVLSLEPTSLFLLIGGNNFINNPDTKPEEVIPYFHELMRRLKTALPHTRLRVISCLPLNPMSKWCEGRNDKIHAYNRMLMGLATRYGYTYLDLASHLTDTAGNLRPEFTFDGIHLNAEAYAVFTQMIKNAL